MIALAVYSHNNGQFFPELNNYPIYYFKLFKYSSEIM